MPFLPRSRFAADSSGQAAIVRLPRQAPRWPAHLLIMLAFGVAALGAAMLLGLEGPAWVVLCVFAALTMAGITTLEIRKQQRVTFMDGAVEAVSGTIGARIPSRELVRPSRWAGGWVGVPQRIRIRYSATVNDTDPAFVEAILEHLRRRLGVQYRVKKQRPRVCVIQLEIDPVELAAKNPDVERAKKTVHNILGVAVTKITCETTPDGAVSAITIRDELDVRASMASYRHRIDKAISSYLPGQWRSRWKLEQDEVRFELRPPMPDRVDHELLESYPEVDHASYEKCRLPIGVDEDENVIYWQPSVSPHLLIIGGTGSGKTSAEHTILTELALRKNRIWVLDGKRIEFAGFREWPNVELVASRVEHQVRMLHAAHDLMEQRYTLIEAGQARIPDFEPLYVIIDEWATFQSRVVNWYASVKPARGGASKAPVFSLVGDIARLGRSAKIHMVVGIQRPDVEFLGGEMRDNFGGRLSLGRLSPQGAVMMWDSAATGVAIPRGKRGRGVSLNEDSLPVDVQTYFTPDPAKVDPSKPAELAMIERFRAATEVRHPRKMIQDPKPELDGDKGVMLDPKYNEWASALIVPFDDRLAVAQSIAASATSDFDEDQPTRASAKTDEAVDDEFEGYTAREDGVAISSLMPGDLVLVDESLDMWGVVQQWEGDLLDEDNMAIDYVDFETGEPNVISYPEGERLTVRRPTEDNKLHP